MTAPTQDDPRTARGRREVPVVLRLVGFGLAVAVALVAALAAGATVGPDDDRSSAAASPPERHDGDHAGHGGDGSAATRSTSTPGVPGGLQVSQDGYTLDLQETVLAGGSRTIAFTIDDATGRPLEEYQVEHEKELHLIAVRRDFTGFQHVHPERAADGTWSTQVSLSPGTWRMFADFTPGDAPDAAPLTLGADLAVTGTPTAAPQQPETTRTSSVEGYEVTLTGNLSAGNESRLRFTVTRDGRPIDGLQPYLGARGHLVALREGDLAYLHVHPTDEGNPARSEVDFAATPPSPGTYRLYLDFRHEGVVRTATIILPATDSSVARAGDGSEGHGSDGHDH